jgi:hypothetical protein
MLNMPKAFSPEAAYLVSKLLDRNPKKRLELGKHGAAAIKRHPFFHVSVICYMLSVYVIKQ